MRHHLPIVVLALISALMALGCAHGTPILQTVSADAPTGFVQAFLGVPVDADFNPLTGGDAGPLFAGDPLCSPIGEWKSDRGVVGDRQELKANLRAWVANGNLAAQQEHTYGYYRAMHLTRSCLIPPGSPLRKAPPGSTYFVSKILFGHSYTVVVHGESRSFTAGVGADFAIFGGSASAFAKQYNLTQSGFGKGLQPVTEASLFSEPMKIADNYRAPNEEPDAVIVEYTQLPDAVLPTAPGPLPERLVEVRFSSLIVRSRGADMLSSHWSMFVQCYINNQPDQEHTEFLDVDLSEGTLPVTFARSLHVHDDDSIECKVEGTYTRHFARSKLAPASTGAISIPPGGAPNSGVLSSRDANTDYSIAWTASRLR